MMLLLFMFANVMHHGGDPLAKHEEWLSANPAYQVDTKIVLGKNEPALAALTVERGKRLLYRVKWLGHEYSVSSTEKSFVEIEYTNKVYDEREPIGYGLYDSRISGVLSATFPGFLLRVGLRRLMSNPKITSDSNGYYVTSHSTTMEGELDLQAWISPIGSLSRFHQTIKSSRGVGETDWVFTNYKRVAQPTLAMFATPLPLGFVPHALPEDPFPIQKNETLPLAGWTDPKKKQVVNLLRTLDGKTALVALLGKDSDPSQRSMASIARLRKSIPVVVLSEDPKQPEAYIDPSGYALAKLKHQATPTFWLIDGKGKVLKVWMGYDQDNATEFEKDVLGTEKAK
jgi:hypothetical protein